MNKQTLGIPSNGFLTIDYACLVNNFKTSRIFSKKIKRLEKK